MIQLSIILPCYNPSPNWGNLIINAYEEITKSIDKQSIELIIVNDGSKGILEDDINLLTTTILNFRYLDNQDNEGKGAALRSGVKEAIGKYLIFTDIDFPYEISSFIKIYDALSKDNQDVVIGVKDESYYAYLPKHRKLISKWLRKCIKWFIKLPITDTQCGLKGFNTKGKTIFLETTINRYLFDLEFVYLCFHQEVAIEVAPVKVTLKPDIIFTKMNYKIIREEGLNFVKILKKRRQK